MTGIIHLGLITNPTFNVQNITVTTQLLPNTRGQLIFKIVNTLNPWTFNQVSELINEMNQDAQLVDQLLTDATLPSGAGTPGLRLKRVLDSNPGVRDLAGLQPLIADQKTIDEKILRGQITGGAPAPGAVPNTENRTLIGGHSQEIRNDPEYVIDRTVVNLNTTEYVSFRKLVRSDANGFAADVNNGIAGNIVDTILGYVNVAQGLGNAPPGYPAQVPEGVQLNWHSGRLLHIGVAIQESQRAHNAAIDARAAAQTAQGDPNNAAVMAPFIDAVVNLNTHAMNALTSAKLIENQTGGQTAEIARQNLQAAFTNWQQNGPVLSANKNSTFAPPGWTDDQVLQAGDQTAATPATLVRYNPPANNPNDGDIVDSKHQRLINGIVWVVMKENVTYHAGPPPTLEGGNVISSYPTHDTAIPAPPAIMDTDRFSQLR